ncbi:MAG: hypothetical protein HQL37_12625 [Alphaproteobacteria bacterium]|nr:hypothetical protein [Alphaproteobacteria bacterium]
MFPLLAGPASAADRLRCARRWATSPLFDTARFARDLEAAYPDILGTAAG